MHAPGLSGAVLFFSPLRAVANPASDQRSSEQVQARVFGNPAVGRRLGLKAIDAWAPP